MIQYWKLNNACLLQALADNLRARGQKVDDLDWLIFLSLKFLIQHTLNAPTRITIVPLIVRLILWRRRLPFLITVPQDTREFLLKSTSGLEWLVVRTTWGEVREVDTFWPLVSQIYCLRGHCLYATYDEVDESWKIRMTIRIGG